MNKDEALRMALEAFEEIDGINTETECITIDVDDVIKVIKEALAQPEPKWVGLTNDEVNNFAAGCHLGKSVQAAIYNAEAKLKQKNGYAEEKNT